MTGRSDCYIRKLVISLLILSGLALSLYSQSDKIGGIVNVYKHVETIGPGTDNVTLSDVASISVGDTVLLIQMKGALIYVPESGSYGGYRESYGASGSSEFLIIQSILSNTVTFTADILNSYDVRGMVQLIRVPYYNSATVNTELTCQPWDSISKTGGVLAMIVGKTLSLNADINVTGKGFSGGAAPTGAGICIETNSSLYDKFSFPVSNANSGYKGESQVIRVFIDLLTIPPYLPDYAKGKGANFTAGGGGNGRFSGGGGGANYGTGGRGGREMNTCLTPADGGIGGRYLKFTDLDGNIFLGSGGGSSTYGTGGTASPGASGGGIVMILCDTLKGKGKVIAANGGTPSITASGNAGAGGGGGGGSIALFQQSFGLIADSSELTISANGGKGGDNVGQFGEGGGGGGGLINTNSVSFPGNVIRTVTGGLVGSRSGSSTGGSGTSGDKITSFAPILNGFLFNSIRSSVTGTQIDSTCSDMMPPVISGTKPVGGTLPYTYLWEKSYDQAAWTTLTNDADPTNYTPTLIETNTVYFRRTVTDSDPTTPLVDISKVVKIIVQPAITGNLVGKDTTICYGQDPISLIPLNAGPSNGSSSNYYLYKWIQNNTNTGWDTSPDADGVFANAAYDPPGLNETTYYQRVVTSGRCVDYSSTVTITVLPSITGNTITQPDEVICEGSLFALLNASAAGGGDLSYKYQWQDSIATSLIYLPAVGTNTATSYTPDTSTFSVVEQRYLRRVVFSGPDSVCQDRSNPILLTRYHKIENNTITADQTICSGDTPSDLAGSSPAFGSLSYTYIWQDSTLAGVWTSLGQTGIDFSATALTDTTWYRRIVNSSICTNVSPAIRIDVHKPIINNNISLLAGGLTDTTICNGALPNLLNGPLASGGTDIPGDYGYQWLYSTDNSTWNPVPSGGTSLSYQAPVLTDTTYYKRQVISGTCTDISNTITITVLPLISNNVISTNQTVCYNTIPALLTGVVLSGGEGAGSYTFLWEESPDGTSWTPAAGTNNAVSYQAPALTVPMKYKRVVTSGLNGCCISISNVIDIGIYALPTGQITNIADTTICGGSNVNLKVHLSGASPWIITTSENGVDRAAEPPISTADASVSIVPASASSVNNYNYTISKLIDNNGCIATSLTGAKKAIVYKVPIADAGSYPVNCGPTIDLVAKPSVGIGSWYYPSEVVASTGFGASSTITIDTATFVNGQISYDFIWKEINWQCKDEATVTIFFDREPTINAGPDIDPLYTFDNTVRMSATPKKAWETASWVSALGSYIIDTETDNKTLMKNLVEGNNVFLWRIENGTCVSEDSVYINVFKERIPEGFSPNNGDTINNTFQIESITISQEAELSIFSGSGTQVYYQKKASGDEWADWDGRNSRGIDLPEGTYYYLLKIYSGDAQGNFVRKGFIIIKRSKN